MKKRVKVLLIVVLGIVALFGIFTGVCALCVHNAASGDAVIDNVAICGVDVGGKTVKEAAKELASQEKMPDSRIMKISLKDKEISFELRNAGISFDINKTVNKAYEIGRKGNVYKNAWTVLTNKTFNIEPVYTENINSFRQTVLTLFAEQGIEFNKFVYELTDNTAKIKITRNYEEINFEKLFKEAIEGVKEEKLELKAECVAGKAVTAEEIYNKLSVKTTDARADEKDGITIIIPETDGVSVELEDITKNLYEGKEEFEIPIKREQAKVTVKSIQGDFFSDVLGSFTTYYNQGVTGRAANIALAASKINNTVLNVGDVFSFNDVVGRTTASNGFSMATVYTAEGMKPGIGGGICQVSSTLYNAVLYADLKIVNRQHHSYTVAYVKNGLDATVSYGSVDFKFKNETKGPVKIAAYAGGGAVTVTIYGKKLNNNKITLSSTDLAYYPYETIEKENEALAPGEKKVVQEGSDGVKASVMKTVTDEKGNIIKQESLGVNYYQPMNKIVETGKPLPEEPSAEIPSDIAPPDVAVPPAENTLTEANL